MSDSAIPWTVAHQAPLSMGFSRQEYWSGLLCPPLGNLPDPGIGPRSPALQADALSSEPPGTPCVCVCVCYWALKTQEWAFVQFCFDPGKSTETLVHPLII